MNDAHEQEARRKAFLDWAEDEIQNIDCLRLDNGEASLLTRYKKTILFGILETLAKAFDTDPSSRIRFVKLVEAQGVWEDATRISVVHLARALDLDKSNKWGALRYFLQNDFAWAFEAALDSADERSILDDPELSDIERYVKKAYPSASGGTECGGDGMR